MGIGDDVKIKFGLFDYIGIGVVKCVIIFFYMVMEFYFKVL